jgi:hypothetical protein
MKPAKHGTKANSTERKETMKLFAKAPERRHQKRFSVMGKPLALLRPGPARPGQVTRISSDTVEIGYDQLNGGHLPETDEIDIVAADFGQVFLLERIPVKTISDRAEKPTDDRPYSSARKRVLAFTHLTADQRSQLQSFIYTLAY